MEGKLSKDNLTAEIIIKKGDINVNLKGLELDKITRLSLYSENKNDLHILCQYPNIETLNLYGKVCGLDSLLELKQLKELTLIDFSGADFIGLNKLSLRTISVINSTIGENFLELLSESVEYLYLDNIKKMESLEFVEKATGLKKLFMADIPWIDTLPNFNKLKNLYALKLYGLHKLNNIDNLIHSNIEYLACSLVADKITGTKFADTLLRMKFLKQADMHLLDRNDRRYPTLKNKLAKEGKEGLLTDFGGFNTWIKL